jgi:GST-like protein
MYELYSLGTPNGKKVTILLEECGLPYKIVPVNIGRGDQFGKEFLEMNPNHRMPVMVDHEPLDSSKGGGGKPIAIFESGAIMMYIAEKVGKFWPQDTRTKYDVVQWVIWQMANQGPKLGEAGHFRRLGDREGDQKYAVTRFTDEANRLYGVLNNRLADRPWLAGKEYTIADMICYPWTVNHKVQGQDLEEFKHVKRWSEEIAKRPAVQKGLAVGADLSTDVTKLPPEEQARIRKLLYNQRAIPVA